MKNMKLIVISIASTLFLLACKPSPEEARKYNDDLIAIETELTAKETAFIATISDAKTVEEKNTAYAAFVKQANEAIAAAEKMPAFDNYTNYADVAKEYFGTIKGLTNVEYKQLLDLSSKKPEEITEEDTQQYNKLLTTIQDKSDAVLVKIQNEQLVFAAKYKFQLENAAPESK